MKKLIMFMLIAVFAVAFVNSSSVDTANYVCENGQRLGDVNGDGEIRQEDAQIVMDIFLELSEFPEGESEFCGDVNADGNLDNVDAVLINAHVDGHKILPEKYYNPEEPEEPQEAEDMLAEPVLGDSDAEIEIVGYMGYNDPFSQSSWKDVMKILDEYEGEVKFVFRNYPLFQDEDRKIAQVGECVFSMSDNETFFGYSDILMNTNENDMVSSAYHGLKVGMDPSRIIDCVDEKKYLPEVLDDIESGDEKGVSGTPTFYINGREVRGDVGYDKFAEVIEEIKNEGKEDSYVCEQSSFSGDVNGDGKITEKDSDIVFDIFLGNKEMPENIRCGDVNEDGNLDSVDGVLIRNHALGNTNIFSGDYVCNENSIEGDVNGDNEVTADDVYIASEILLGNLPLPDNGSCLDVNGDGSFNNKDIALIKKIVSEGLEESEVIPIFMPETEIDFSISENDDEDNSEKEKVEENDEGSEKSSESSVRDNEKELEHNSNFNSEMDESSKSDSDVSEDNTIKLGSGNTNKDRKGLFDFIFGVFR